MRSSCRPGHPVLQVASGRRLRAGVVLAIAHGLAWGSAPQTGPVDQRELTRCVLAASSRHGVNPDLLTAILRVESGLRADPVRRNTNGSIDVGIAQINSVHFAELRQHGLEWPHLLQPCVGIHVAAWHLKKQVLRHGNTWHAVGAYHSLTPQFNRVYQARVQQELRRMGKLAAR